MLFNTLITKILTYIKENPEHKGVKDIHQVAETVKLDVGDMLRRSDVRNIGLIRDLVPDAFPKKLRQGPLLGSQNIHNAWRVVPLTPTTKITNQVVL